MRARIIGTVAVTLFVVTWEGVVRLGTINPLFTSSPTRIVSTFFQMTHEGVLAKDIRVSSTEFAIGYSMAIVVGILVGVAMGWYRDVSAALQPFVSALYSTPRIALVPLFIIWLGIGIWSKVAVVFLVAVFQIHISAVAGETFQTDRVFVGIVILASAAIVLVWALRLLELRFESWNPQHQM